MDNKVDALSRLSTSLLIMILSLLPFREAARTGVLARQWRHLWRETTNIEFNENFFVRTDESLEEQHFQRCAFITFVKSFLTQYSQAVIDRFVLVSSRPNHFLLDMTNSINFAVSRHVKDLELDFSDPTWEEDIYDDCYEADFELPSHVYEFGSLIESLKLYSCIFNASRFCNFQALKSLSLGWISISMASLDVVLRDCPLESLSLKRCWNLEHFHISSSELGLKRLVIDKCEFVHDYLSIQGPTFEYFKYSGSVAQFYLENQLEMKEADLDFRMETEFGEGLGVYIYDLVLELCAVRVLTVCSALLQIIPSGEEPTCLQTPMQVRHLIMKTAVHENEYYGIRFMLYSCPLLEILTLDIGPARIFEDYEPPFAFSVDDFWTTNSDMVQRCIDSTLRVVNVKGFKGTVNQLYLLRYILHFGRSLEEFNIYVSNEDGEDGTNRDTNMARAHGITQLYRAARNLRISFF
ncbi:hypothetical protein Tsubulata_026036 [Turnera subulata]|uniref:FBD domain-containing protein n=1 Tax=Turnera subulata TaxID=218843 RepID=A0A9Q0FZV7_9ROSI|nr:hypothetical protein Tsubulata_026036 [Turnera subulata]